MKYASASVMLAALLLTGCTAAQPAPTVTVTATASPTTAPTMTPRAQPSPSIASVAKTLGITDYKQDSEAAPYVAEWGEATYEGKKVNLYRFDSDADYKEYLGVVKAYGVVSSWLVKDGLIVVAPDDQTQIASIKNALGVS